MKRVGIGQRDLVRFYISVIRPVVEYACPAWHTNLPKYLSDNIELIQKRCMKTLFPGCRYDAILEMTNLPTLHDRRTTLKACHTRVASSRRPRGDQEKVHRGVQGDDTAIPLRCEQSQQKCTKAA